MGNCSGKLIHSTNSLSTFDDNYQRLMKCPKGHRLAFFQSQECKLCKRRFSKAIVNCIKCQFGVCQRCFDNNFQNWIRKASIKDRNKIKNFIKQFNQEEFQDSQATIQAQRLRKYLISKFQEDKHIRTQGCPILRQSIRVRTQMVKNYLILRSKSV